MKNSIAINYYYCRFINFCAAICYIW